MNSTTPLFRQVHPTWVHEGRVTSLVFRPMPKDEGKLSVYDGDMIDPEPAFNHYVEELGFQSVGVLGIYVYECEELELPVVSDPQPFPEHALIDFTGHTNSRAEKIAKILRNKSMPRGWLHQA